MTLREWSFRRWNFCGVVIKRDLVLDVLRAMSFKLAHANTPEASRLRQAFNSRIVELDWVIDNICSIVNSRLSLLRRIKPFLNHHCALRFFNSCIHNLFIYCSSAWGNCSSYLLSRLLRLQKRAARLLLDADFTEPSVSLFSKLKWLPIFDLIKLRKLVILFTILNNPDAPLCLKRKFNFLSSVRSAGLRTRACAFNLHVPYPRSNSGKRTFAYSAATLFNCLDTDLKQIACVSPSSIIFSSKLNNFKHKLFILFLKFASSVSHLEELMCRGCRFSLYCNCIRR